LATDSVFEFSITKGSSRLRDANLDAINGARRMALILGRLKAALIAGNIPVTDEALATLNAGLSTIGHGYHIEKVFSRKPKTADLKRNLSRSELVSGTQIPC
jgi:hypothetical protein